MDDFNFHVENHENELHVQRLLSLIGAFGLIQCVRQPTDLQGRTLTIVQEVTVENPPTFTINL